jgi:Zn-dependent oligopeptidase
MSKHYTTGKPIPPALVKSLVASKNANTGYFNKRQLVHVARLSESIVTLVIEDAMRSHRMLLV